MKELEGGLENVPGFKFSAVKCGIRYADRLDYCLIAADSMCSGAGVFTQNALAAAPVRLCRENIKQPVKAVLINSTNANACTGRTGYNNARYLSGDMAELLNVHPSSVLMCSTGIIGEQLPEEKMAAVHQTLVDALSPENGDLISRAIMTTDTVPKKKAVSFETSKGTFTLAGTAKGAGMLAPNMATLLSFFLTDAPVPKARLQSIFEWAVSQTLNRISVDGDTSTNDTAIILSPVSDDPLTDEDDLNAFTEALMSVLGNIAENIVRDGEGATKLIHVEIRHAASDEDALRMAKKIAESVLVKTAFFGEDPNWGRIAMAIGNSGAGVNEESLSISFGDCMFLNNGKPQKNDPDKIKEVMSQKEITVLVDCGLGSGEASYITSDLSYEYVKINAEYTT